MKIDRLVVRALAEKNSKELRDFASAGGNVYQKSLEQGDYIKEIISKMDVNEAINFNDMYIEELDACTKKTIDDTEIIKSNTEKTIKKIEIKVLFIGIIIVAAIFIIGKMLGL